MKEYEFRIIKNGLYDYSIEVLVTNTIRTWLKLSPVWIKAHKAEDKNLIPNKYSFYSSYEDLKSAEEAITYWSSSVKEAAKYPVTVAESIKVST